MTSLEILEALSYIVTIVGLPMAIFVFIYEQRRERSNEDEELYQRLSDEYAEFLKLVLENSDLQIRSHPSHKPLLNEEQIERRNILFEILVSLFERAYILVYEPNMDRQAHRLWFSWEDYMREWCRREDFRQLLPRLLEGEDEDFQKHILQVSAQVVAESNNKAALR
jgi:hypothetical protein